MTTQKNSNKRGPAKYSGRAKFVTSAAALVALLGGWNAIGHLENTAQAGTSAKNTVTGQQAADAITLQSLGIAPIAPLAPLPQASAQDRAQDSAQTAAGQTGPARQLPDLPTLQALPAIPTLPAQQPFATSGVMQSGSQSSGMRSGGS
jgi:hypothetical protein